jgi:hypothetical protein
MSDRVRRSCDGENWRLFPTGFSPRARANGQIDGSVLYHSPLGFATRLTGKEFNSMSSVTQSRAGGSDVVPYLVNCLPLPFSLARAH